MEQIPSNSPMMQPASGASGWLPIWIKAVTKPSEQTFIEITSSPEASSKTAFIWVFITGTLSGLVTGLIQMALLAAGFQSQGFGQFSGAAGRGIGASLGFAICGAPVYGLLSVIGLAIGAAIIQWIAKLFGGTGTFEKMAYAIAAISVPITVVTMFLTPLSAVPYLGICTGLLSAGIGLYALFLQITAVKAVNGFGWGPAIGSVLLPGVVIGLVCACIVGAGMAMMGPQIAEIFRQINQGLAP
jgi:hypothetical protein